MNLIEEILKSDYDFDLRNHTITDFDLYRDDRKNNRKIYKISVDGKLDFLQIVKDDEPLERTADNMISLINRSLEHFRSIDETLLLGGKKIYIGDDEVNAKGGERLVYLSQGTVVQIRKAGKNETLETFTQEYEEEDNQV